MRPMAPALDFELALKCDSSYTTAAIRAGSRWYFWP